MSHTLNQVTISQADAAMKAEKFAHPCGRKEVLTALVFGKTQIVLILQVLPCFQVCTVGLAQEEGREPPTLPFVFKEIRRRGRKMEIQV